jgi:hypothetical protein
MKDGLAGSEPHTLGPGRIEPKIGRIATGIVSRMLPLASASGSAIIAVAVIGSGLFLWWLLRQEASDEDGEEAAPDNDAAPDQRDR